jgi:hypothetical protein
MRQCLNQTTMMVPKKIYILNVDELPVYLNAGKILVINKRGWY